MKKKNGFTLVELLGVVVIMAVILSIVLISLTKIRQRANKMSWDEIQSEVETAAKEYLIANEHLKTDCESGNCNILVSVGTLVKEDYLNKVSDEQGNLVNSCDVVYIQNNRGIITSTYYKYDDRNTIIENNSSLSDFFEKNNCEMIQKKITALSVDSNPDPTCQGDNCNDDCIGDACQDPSICNGDDCPCVGDNCKPEIEVINQDCPNFTYNENDNTKWYNDDISVNYALNPGVKYYYNNYIYNSNKQWVQLTNTTLLSENTSTEKKTINLYLKDGITKAVLHIKDSTKENNCSTKAFKIDKTKPTVSITGIPKVETSSNISFKITAKDNLSGIKTIQYSFDNKKWTNYTSGTFVSLLTKTGTKTVYARSIDKAGNKSNVIHATGKCDKDKVKIDPKDLKGAYFTLKFTSYYNTFSTKTYQYVYWNAINAGDDTTNKRASTVNKVCGDAPPTSNNAMLTTTSGYTTKLYMKYKRQYYCFAVRPYRKSELGVNRWTVQYKHAKTTKSINSSNYNGKPN